MRLRTIPVLMMLLALFCGRPAQAGIRPTSLTVFGDSLSDVGNISQASFGFVPGGSYFGGRFSNGPVYSELLGFELTRSLAGGSNYAYGGARAGSSLFDLSTQLSAFSQDHSGSADPDELYIMWFGGNDVIGGYDSGDPSAGEAAIDTALTAFEQGLGELLEMGAETVIVPNLPDLSLAPDVTEQNDPGTTALARALTLRWNAGLEQIVANLDEPGVELFDVFTLFDELFADPQASGFTDLRRQAISSPGDDDGFLFWDNVHPTASAHRLLAERMLAEASVFAPCPPPTITEIAYDLQERSARLCFTSNPGERFRVEFSTSLAGEWSVLADELPSQGIETIYDDRSGSAAARSGFYQVHRLASP